mmetsp:Transcript_1347/g.2050  ORF Transcript_1347/g.2050 Transcript_1347/m.2050 type:complete len:612 (+) Transcript_1347:253-2088(+)
MSSMISILSGCSILVTGGTGFLGRALIEKVLRCVPSIKKIYTIARPRKVGKSKRSAEEVVVSNEPQTHLPGSRCETLERCCCSRIYEMMTSPVFERLRASGQLDSLVQEKLVAVAGDLFENVMGLSEADAKFLREEIDIIIHLGANIDFNDPMMECIRPNCLGTLNVLKFAHTCTKLKGFVHTSTAWASASTPGFNKEVLPMMKIAGKDADPEELLHEIVQLEHTPRAERRYKRILRDTHYPNTYTFTKSLTEHLLAKLHRDIPLYIVRPSIVTSAWRDPVPGFIDQVASITFLIIAGGKGYIHDLPCKPGKSVDIIPLDITINALLLAGATLVNTTNHDACLPPNNQVTTPLATIFRPTPSITLPQPYDPRVAEQSLKIVHVTSSVLHPVRMESMFATVCEEFIFSPPKATQGRRVYAHFTPIWQIHAKLRLAKNLGVPILKAISALRPNMTRLTNLKIAQLKKATNFLDVYEFFLRCDWKFDSSLPMLSRAPFFSDSDRSVFSVDLKKVDWKIYIKNLTDGVQRDMMKEESAPRPIIQARRSSLDYLDITTDPYLKQNCDALITVDGQYSLPGYILSSLKVRSSYSDKLFKKGPKFIKESDVEPPEIPL